MVTDAASAVTNLINGIQAAHNHDYAAAGWDLGTFLLSAGGRGAATRALRAERTLQEVETTAGNVAGSTMEAPLLQARSAGSLEEKMTAIRSAISGAHSYIQVGAEFDREAGATMLALELAQSQGLMLSMASLNYGIEECAHGECG